MDGTLYFSLQRKELYADHISYPNPLSIPFMPHTHDICELLYIKSGQISYLKEGKAYPLPKDTLVVIPPACIHRIRVDGPETYERYDMLFDIRGRLPKLYTALQACPDVVFFADYPIVAGLFKKLDDYCERFSEDSFCRLVELLIEELLYHVLQASPRQPVQLSAADNPLIRQAVRYIEDNICTIRSIEDICSALYITKSHLHHLFTRYMQITPKKYILSKRLILAQISIRAGAKPTEVYARYGFSNYSTFYRAYLSFFGYCPSEEPSMFRTNHVQT